MKIHDQLNLPADLPENVRTVIEALHARIRELENAVDELQKKRPNPPKFL